MNSDDGVRQKTGSTHGMANEVPEGLVLDLTFDGDEERRHKLVPHPCDGYDWRFIVQERTDDGHWRTVGTQDVTDASATVNTKIAGTIETAGRHTSI